MHGETYMNKAECLVYKVSINTYSRPFFTNGFVNGLRSLQRASKEPHTEKSRQARIKFVEEYGTYYQSECYMGASMTTISRMSSKSKTVEERSKRMECVSKAFEYANHQGVHLQEFDLSAGVGVGPASVGVSTRVGGWGKESSKAFGDASSRCDENSDSKSALSSIGVEQSEIVSVGVLPYTDKEKWIDAIKEAPSSAKFTLTDITNLLTPLNLNHIPLDPDNPDGEMLDAELLRD